MRLSTSTNLFAYRPDFNDFIPIIDSIKMCKKVGFDAVDINLCDVTRHYYRLADPDWREWIAEVKETSEKLNIPITQSHTPFYNCLDPNFAQRDEYDKMIRRSIIASGMLDVPWIVMHPGTLPEENGEGRKSKKGNYEYFMPLLELADKCNTGIAIENMSGMHENGQRVYCSSFEQLIDLVDSLPVDNAGICWDFGHAHLEKVNQIEALHAMGSRLKATHVADNSGQRDDHIMPFAGHVNWYEIMPALTEIDYQGDFTYEIHSATSKLPDELLEDLGCYCVKIGRYLTNLADS